LKLPPEPRHEVFLDPKANFSFLFLGSCAAIMAGLYYFVRGFRVLYRKRLIETTPTSKIRAAAIGPLEIYGKTTGPYSLISPISMVDCYYYEAVASLQVGEGSQSRWKEVARESVCVPFFVSDDTGSLMIDARGAELNLPAEFDGEIDAYGPSESIRHFLGRHGVAGAGRVKVRERVVKADQDLYVLGTLGEHSGAEAYSAELNLDEKETRILSQEGADLQRRIALSMMSIDVAPRTVLPSVAPQQKFARDAACAIQKGSAGRPFVIAASSERELLHEMARSAKLCVLGGPALVLIGLATLLWILAPR
jgi:hypothetical protein